MLQICSRTDFLALMYSINAVIDSFSESNNEEVLLSIFVIVASSLAFFRWHPSKEENIRIIQKMNTATPTQIIATIMMFLWLSILENLIKAGATPKQTGKSFAPKNFQFSQTIPIPSAPAQKRTASRATKINAGRGIIDDENTNDENRNVNIGAATTGRLSRRDRLEQYRKEQKAAIERNRKKNVVPFRCGKVHHPVDSLAALPPVPDTKNDQAKICLIHFYKRGIII